MPSGVAHVVLGFEILLVLVGLVLLWKHVISPRARRTPVQSPLPNWRAEPAEFLVFLFAVMMGTFVVALAAGTLVKSAGFTGDQAVILAGAGSQLGMLLGVTVYAARAPSYRQQSSASARSVLLSGAATFMIALPVLDATAKGWELLLQLFGLPAERQDLIRMFAEAESAWMIVGLVVLAGVVAPLTEELVFRAGLFRYLRTRAPRALALFVPAVIFASLHVNWGTLEGFASFMPLLVLAVVFSLAYERTGHVGTVIVAHGLFNLNTIALIFSGVAVS